MLNTLGHVGFLLKKTTSVKAFALTLDTAKPNITSGFYKTRWAGQVI
jgi:hypothetical protein